jgi:hypothetical protein
MMRGGIHAFGFNYGKAEQLRASGSAPHWQTIRSQPQIKVHVWDVWDDVVHYSGKRALNSGRKERGKVDVYF